MGVSVGDSVLETASGLEVGTRGVGVEPCAGAQEVNTAKTKQTTHSRIHLDLKPASVQLANQEYRRNIHYFAPLENNKVPPATGGTLFR